MKSSKLFAQIFLIALSFLSYNVKGQNLVPNGDFETNTACPTAYSQITNAIPWDVPTITGSSDYYHQCAPNSSVGVPVNVGTLGYQPAHSGEAYSGIYIFLSANSREYLEVPLTSPLITGQCYHLEMFVNVLNTSRFTQSTLGVYLSDTLISGINIYTNLPYLPQINNAPGNMFDTLNWTLVSANYTAHGGESFLIIGNFSDNFNTDTLQINASASPYCYVYIDDVCLTTCGGSCATGIEEQNPEGEIICYPNPVKDELFVIGYSPAPYLSGLSGKEKAEIIITDILGKEVYRNQFSNSSEGFHSDKLQIPTSNFRSGIYFIEIYEGKNIFRKKFMKE